MTKEEIIKEYFQSMAEKSHKAVKEKYGIEHYRKMSKSRWDKDKLVVKVT